MGWRCDPLHIPSAPVRARGYTLAVRPSNVRSHQATARTDSAGLIAAPGAQVRALSEAAEEPVRQFVELRYRTLETWSCERRVVAKAEHIIGKANPRFVVTSLSIDDVGAKALYKNVYCVSSVN